MTRAVPRASSRRAGPRATGSSGPAAESETLRSAQARSRAPRASRRRQASPYSRRIESRRPRTALSRRGNAYLSRFGPSQPALCARDVSPRRSRSIPTTSARWAGIAASHSLQFLHAEPTLRPLGSRDRGRRTGARAESAVGRITARARTRRGDARRTTPRPTPHSRSPSRSTPTLFQVWYYHGRGCAESKEITIARCRSLPQGRLPRIHSTARQLRSRRTVTPAARVA